MPTYSTSTGQRFTTEQIDRKIRLAKQQKLELQRDQCGYNRCEECGVNGSGTRLDCSHTVSVKEAKETGRSELCWTVSNIRVLCRRCHQVYDKLHIQSAKV